MQRFPSCIRSWYAVVRFFILWVRDPPLGWIFCCCCFYCCVLSGTGVCDELITRWEQSYRLECVVVCHPQTSRIKRPWPVVSTYAKRKKISKGLSNWVQSQVMLNIASIILRKHIRVSELLLTKWISQYLTWDTYYCDNRQALLRSPKRWTAVARLLFRGFQSRNWDVIFCSCCDCCVLSHRGLRDKLIIRSAQSYRLECVVAWHLQTSRMRRP